jgi:hypothetical protein
MLMDNKQIVFLIHQLAWVGNAETPTFYASSLKEKVLNLLVSLSSFDAEAGCELETGVCSWLPGCVGVVVITIYVLTTYLLGILILCSKFNLNNVRHS